MKPQLKQQDVYAKLRDWYLARLRQDATKQEMQANLTPLAKIESDKLFIERVVLDASEPVQRLCEISGTQLAVKSLLFWASGLFLAFLFGLTQSRFDPGVTSREVLSHSLGLLFGLAEGMEPENHRVALLVEGFVFGAPLFLLNLWPAQKLLESGFRLKRRLKWDLSSLVLLLLSLLAIACLLALEAAAAGPLLKGLAAWLCLLLGFYCSVKKHKDEIEYASLESMIGGNSGSRQELLGLEKEALLEGLGELLRISQARENAIADYSGELICSISEQGQILAVNQASLQVLAFQPLELLNKSFTSLFVEREQKQVEEVLLHCKKAGGAAAEFESVAVSRQGKLIDLKWSFEWSERERLYFALARDITLAKTIERTRQEYVSMISHDVRIPLTAILFGLGNMNQGYLGELSQDQKTALARARENIERVIDLLNELIDLERSVNDKLVLDLSVFRIHDAALKAAEMLSDQAENVSVNIEICGQNFSVKADHNRITRVLSNLVSNALKHAPEGSVVKVETVEKPGEFEIRVSDNGPGVPRQLQAAIFDRYVQLHLPEERTTNISSSGLGLAICKLFVESHGGSIGVDSAEGNGSTFWFTLPSRV